MSGRLSAIIKLNLAVLLAGGTGLFGRLISLSELPLVWYRMIFALVFLFLIMALSGLLHRMPVRDFLKILGCGMILSLHWTLFYGSIKFSNVSVGVICFAPAGFFTALLEPLINRHKMSLKQFLLGFISIVGIMLIFSLDPRYRLGIAMGLVSAALYSLFSILHKNTVKLVRQSSGTMLMIELLGGVVLLSALLPFYHLAFPSVTLQPTAMDFLWLVILASLLTVLPLFLQLQALNWLSAFTVNICYNLEPVYSIVAAMLIFNESRELGFSFWLGVTLVVLSVVLEFFSRRSESSSRTP